ncbi:MAG: acyl-CoA dehydrogenase family protein [Candidatus Thorarchaeota archaeon]|nr:MAG: acyl-CoA dehydrogenase family protein [Candidatus Thorarchaeota archaeon]
MDALPWWTDKNHRFATEVEEFVDNELRPLGDKMDHNEAMKVQWNISKFVVDKGFHPLAVLVEEEYGGREEGFTGYTILNEEFGRCFLNINPLLTTVFGGGPVHLFGSPEQKENFLEPMVKGEKWTAICVTEPDVGNDAANIQLAAERQGDQYVLNGWKRYITLGAKADYLMVYALTDSSEEAKNTHTHLTSFIIPRETEGITIEKINELTGDVEMFNSVIRFQDVSVPEENMILFEGDGWTVMTSGLNIERLGIAATVGQARMLIETARAYGRRRVQFDAPISRYQTVQLRMADMAMRLKLARTYLYALAMELDSGAADMFQFGVDAAICKVFSTEALIEIAEDALTILSGDGYTSEYLAASILKNALLTRVTGGGNDILRLFIGRQEFKKKPNPSLLPRVLRGVEKKELE